MRRFCHRWFARKWSGARAKGAQGDGEEKRFGEPEGVVGEAGGGPCSKDGSGKEAEADKAEGACFCAALVANLCGDAWCDGVVEAFDCVAQVAGDEGGVISEASDMAITGDLKRTDDRGGCGDDHVGGIDGEPAKGEERYDLKRQTEQQEGALLKVRSQAFRGGNADDE